MVPADVEFGRSGPRRPAVLLAPAVSCGGGGTPLSETACTGPPPARCSVWWAQPSSQPRAGPSAGSDIKGNAVVPESELSDSYEDQSAYFFEKYSKDLLVEVKEHFWQVGPDSRRVPPRVSLRDLRADPAGPVPGDAVRQVLRTGLAPCRSLVPLRAEGSQSGMPCAQPLTCGFAPQGLAELLHQELCDADAEEHHAACLRPFRILVSLLDKPEIGTVRAPAPPSPRTGAAARLGEPKRDEMRAARDFGAAESLELQNPEVP